MVHDDSNIDMRLDNTTADDAWRGGESEMDGIERFIEQMGLSAQADGVPRIAGRIFGYFIVNGGPASFTQLAEELQVSRASVSTNTRILANIGFIERVSRPGDRQDYYQLASSPFLRMIEGYMARMLRMQSILEQARNTIPVDMGATHHRLQQMKDFYDKAVRHNRRFMEELGGNE